MTNKEYRQLKEELEEKGWPYETAEEIARVDLFFNEMERRYQKRQAVHNRAIDILFYLAGGTVGTIIFYKLAQAIL